MADMFTKEERSRRMALIRSTGNKSTEIAFIRALRSEKLTGWRRHPALPGRPDVSFPREHICVFLHGCFWHGCQRCYSAPTSNPRYWRSKLARNQRRDRRVARQLRASGWCVLTLWECQLSENTIALGIGRVRRALASAPINSAPACGRRAAAALRPLAKSQREQPTPVTPAKGQRQTKRGKRR